MVWCTEAVGCVLRRVDRMVMRRRFRGRVPRSAEVWLGLGISEARWIGRLDRSAERSRAIILNGAAYGGECVFRVRPAVGT